MYNNNNEQNKNSVYLDNDENYVIQAKLYNQLAKEFGLSEIKYEKRCSFKSSRV